MSSYIVIKKEEIISAAYIFYMRDGIIRVLFKKNKEIDPDALKRAFFEKFNKIVKGLKFPFIYFAEDGSCIYYRGKHLFKKKKPKCISLKKHVVHL